MAIRLALILIGIVVLAYSPWVRAQDLPRVAPPPPVLQPPGQTPPEPVASSPVPPGTVPVLTSPMSTPGLNSEGEIYLPSGARVSLPSAVSQTIQFSPRYGTLGQFSLTPIGDNTRQLVYTAGLIIKVQYNVPGKPGQLPLIQEYEFAADNVVAWIKGMNDANLLNGVKVDSNSQGPTQREFELYLAGNVVVRSQEITINNGVPVLTQRTLRADEIYYDVNNNKAVCLNADMEIQFPGVRDAVHLTGKEVQQLGRREWRGLDAGVHSSRLPSDPAIKGRAREFSLVERDTPTRNFLGFPYRPWAGGNVGAEKILTARDTRVEALGIPIFYTPYYRADPSEPLGPLVGFGFGNDRIFGFQLYTSWDIYRLLAIKPPTTHRWLLNVDHLNYRGTGIGTDYSFSNPDFFGFGGPNSGTVRVWGLRDKGEDILGLYRGPEPPRDRPDDRGRALFRYNQELFADKDPDTRLYTGERFVYLQSQFAWLSDKNFLEQYYKREFDLGQNQETYLHLAASNGPWHASLLGLGGQRRDWLNETRWLPNATGSLIGQTFMDRFNYNSRVNLGYAQQLPSTQPAGPYLPFYPNDQKTSTARGDWYQELSVPFRLGDVNINPYGVFDLTGYTQDANGQSIGRVYGGGGVRTSSTVSKLYEDVSSELFNLKGLNHKVTLSGNYYYARTNVHYDQLPMLDRLNDDAIDQAYRTMTPLQGFYVPGAKGQALMYNQNFNPQQYAIRRLVDNRIDTRDDIEVVQVDLLQRLQTKRGFTGREHTIDWFTFDLSASFFPNPNRDNFGKSSAFLEYNSIWNIGDRSAISSQGWFDPFDLGTRYWNFGIYHNRPDGTNIYLGYRQTDPLNSKAVIGNLNYPLTRKYSFSAGVAYDFGIQQALVNYFQINRVGTDVTISFGLTYNALQNNLGVQFAIVPNLLFGRAFGAVGPNGFGGRQ